MNNSIQNRKVAFITGATSGLGLSIAQQFAREGYAVYGGGRRQSEHLSDKNLILTTFDITDEVSVQRAVEFVLSREDHIDLLVCAAGYGVSGSIEETPLEDAHAQFDVNFFGVVRTVKAILPIMRSQHSGKIIIIGSAAGKIGMPFQGYYSASKFALEGFVESIRYEVRPFGIEVCVVEPGDFKTGFTAARKKIIKQDSPYREKMLTVIGIQEHDETHGVDPMVAAQRIVSLAASKRFPIRISVGPLFERFAIWVRRILPDALFEVLYKMNYKL